MMKLRAFQTPASMSETTKTMMTTVESQSFDEGSEKNE